MVDARTTSAEDVAQLLGALAVQGKGLIAAIIADAEKQGFSRSDIDEALTWLNLARAKT